ncbi:uncharacterized protein SETTUDRAFT_110663 [Exserohilum turcica Et28A]|uniref:Ribonucleases P/MRP subunit Pop8-like domain-containing protein n=1 Tax=Exserohilum turcicum (strain 28A) TaxID=671987 RepID=R0IM06_EXST2|nr:uncharacterized protein SETTUDRAFT_110663 [Exserohilum turcica Et28A]EOA86060.1 hypothetical protein SETTUDRAFT_110663 [Exserohilum turcica Et28A]
MPDATTTRPARQNRKRKNADDPGKQKESHTVSQCTMRNLPWTYFHLVLVTPSALASTSTCISTSTCTQTQTQTQLQTPSATTQQDMTPLVASPLLTAALRTYLGTMGSAIAVDILKTQGRSVWIRIPGPDARGVRAALSNWVGSADAEDVLGGGEAGRVRVAWRVVAWSGVLGVVVVGGGGDGRDMFG